MKNLSRLFQFNSTIRTSVASFGLAVMSTAAFADKPVLNDWFALGSGCKAKSDLPGNVKMETLPQDPQRPLAYRVKFTFSNFEIHGDSEDKDKETFARECAVRLNINPPKDKKITEIRALTSLATSKDLGATLDLSSELKLGATSLGSIRKTMAASARVEPSEEKIELASNKDKGTPLPNLNCGEAKIIGFDYSWIAKREKKQLSSLSVGLGKEKSLIVEASLSDCK
jgi:hypothetical protein